MGEVTIISWKVLFAKTFSFAAQETVHNLVWQIFDILFEIKGNLFCNK